MNMDRALQPVGLPMPQYAVLCAIEVEPGMSNARLARAALVTVQTMRGVLTNPERAAIVRREPAYENARPSDHPHRDEAEGARPRASGRRRGGGPDDEIDRSRCIGPLAATLYRCANDLAMSPEGPLDPADGPDRITWTQAD